MMMFKTVITLVLATNVATFDNTQFTADVYNEISENSEGNFLVSPFSVETVLALAQSGAKGKTAEEIRTTLHLPNSKEETESAIKNTLPLLQNNDYVLQTANKIYVAKDFRVFDEFKDVANGVYLAELENIEFTKSVEAARGINEWVADQTKDKIKDLVNPEDLGKETGLLLLNALYFQGNWSTPFDSAKTTKKPFYTDVQNEVETEMMLIDSVLANYTQSEDLDAQILELPFKGGASITFILPNKQGGVAHLDKLVDSPQYSIETVQVSLPKFKIGTSIDFGNVLKNLGVDAAFNPTEADFSGIGGKKGDLVIGKVVQKTLIDVNEMGVEAAAATGDITIIGPSVPPPPPTKFFVADHPFVFYLKANDVILFAGRVVAP